MRLKEVARKAGGNQVRVVWWRSKEHSGRREVIEMLQRE